MMNIVDNMAHSFQDGSLKSVTLLNQDAKLQTLTSCGDDDCTLQNAAFSIQASRHTSGSDVIRVCPPLLLAALLVGVCGYSP
jgi:hypothetical protein